ncbi:hypothetical protein SFHH103_04016 (plasmid) [Sinorhizobium fredii HH103]|uniref:Integrase catalytic domain-containing protein n=1 Tax=Sinorhizobium fredii (strain HH103) TaxID=1117943 RepID=G9ABS8_SINF1|nr:hypothetical protein SFHH103_04016 [Sinorhizobium fredii HH103]
METGSEQHPDYAAALEAELVVARAERAAALAELAVAKAKEADNQAIILRQKVHIEKLQRELRGQKSERTSRLIAQMELMLEDAEATATDDARSKMEDWRRDYNEFRPHSAIGNKVPISLMNGSSAPPPN